MYSFCEADDDSGDEDTPAKKFEELCIEGREYGASASDDHLNPENSNGSGSKEVEEKANDKELSACFPNRHAKDVKFVNEGYFGSYSSFGIHREMLGDKARGSD